MCSDPVSRMEVAARKLASNRSLVSESEDNSKSIKTAMLASNLKATSQKKSILIGDCQDKCCAGDGG